MKKLLFTMFLGAATISANAAAWTLDAAHSSVNFRLKHMGVAWISGNFSEFSGTFNANKSDFSDVSTEFGVSPKSVNTGVEDRDNHLRTADFFNVEKFDMIKFKSKGDNKVTEDGILVQGTMSWMGVSKDLTLTVEFGGLAKDPWGNVKAGLVVRGSVDRLAFGIGDETKLDNGDMMLSQKVELIAYIELTQVKEEPKTEKVKTEGDGKLVKDSKKANK